MCLSEFFDKAFTGIDFTILFFSSIDKLISLQVLASLKMIKKSA